LYAKGYVLVVFGGGITGDLQINDTHLHRNLKTAYRLRESKLLIEKLKANPGKIPSPDRREIMEMLVSSLQEVNLDCSRALKENFIFNKLDGSEDHLVTGSLFALVGKEIQMFRSQLMQSTPPRLIADLVKTITPPEGVRSPSAAASSSDSAPPDEGAEVLDGDFVVE